MLCITLKNGLLIPVYETDKSDKSFLSKKGLKFFRASAIKCCNFRKEGNDHVLLRLALVHSYPINIAHIKFLIMQNYYYIVWTCLCFDGSHSSIYITHMVMI